MPAHARLSRALSRFISSSLADVLPLPASGAESLPALPAWGVGVVAVDSPRDLFGGGVADKDLPPMGVIPALPIASIICGWNSALPGVWKALKMWLTTNFSMRSYYFITHAALLISIFIISVMNVPFLLKCE